MSHPCSNPPATTSTARPGTAVLRGAGLGVGSGASDAVLVAVDGTSPTESSPEQAARATPATSATHASEAADRVLMRPSLTRRGRPWHRS